jgi:hypothetical protein
MKRVISFSLWGDNPGYCIGAVENAKRAPNFYPGWVCRFYCDTKVPEEYVKQLLDLGCEVYKRPESIDNIGLYWRFEPMFDDPDIERFIVRDTDSRLNGRESEAVYEWIESDLPFHIIRDNPGHNIEICGGLWGSKARVIPEFPILMKAWLETLVPDPKNPRGIYHGTDQIFLCKYIWPFVKNCHMAHDEYFHYTGRERPFKTKLRRDGYVGMVYTTMDADRVEVVQ